MTTTVELTTTLDCTPDVVWACVQKPALFLHVAAPLVVFRPVGAPEFPKEWDEAEYRGTVRLLGAIPIGWQVIRIRFLPQEGGMRVLVDEGHGPMLRQWSHRIEVAPEGYGTRYTDTLEFSSGALTPLTAPLIRFFFEHRQRRLRALDSEGFAALNE